MRSIRPIKIFATTAGIVALGAVMAGVLTVLLPATPRQATRLDTTAERRNTWVAAWAASPMTEPGVTGAGLAGETVRDIVYTSVGGDMLRVRVSNLFGTQPLVIGAANVGVVLAGARVVPGASQGVSFGGKNGVVVAPGAEVLSDPVVMPVRPLEELAVSLYVRAAAGPVTMHVDAQQDTYVARGDHVTDAGAAAYAQTAPSWYFVDAVDVRSETADGTIVAFGDSITDGYGSEIGADARWPDDLARRLDEAFGDRAPAVVDEGIGGNRVLNNSSCFGQSAINRFERDALSQPGVRAVIVLEGINDIDYSAGPDQGCYAPSARGLTAAQLETGYLRLIAMAHARGVKIYLGTLTPGGVVSSAAVREQVNDWILHNHAADGVVNFAAATSDPGDPLFLNPAYNSGDSLHPNDLGYQAMADAIPLSYTG
jgi:lysophospholipase L1-like esterase